MVLRQLKELSSENPEVANLAVQHVVNRAVERDPALSAEKLLRGAGMPT